MMFIGFFLSDTKKLSGHGSFVYQYVLLMTNLVNIEFLLGIFAGKIYQSMTAEAGKLCRYGMLISLIYFVFCIFSLFDPLPFLPGDHLGCFSISLFFLVLSALKCEKMGARIFARWILFTGEISYSIYLTHMAVIFSLISISHLLFGCDVFDKFSHRFNLFIVSLFLTYLISFLSYQYIEIKLSSWVERKIKVLLPFQTDK